MNRKIFLLIGAVLVLFFAGYWIYSEFNRTVDEMAKEKTDISIEASKLLAKYEQNEEEANASFLDKIIEVTGEIDKIEDSNGQKNIYLSTGSPLSSIICEMENTETSISALKQGDRVTVKGNCTGYLMDVVLVRCILK